MKSLLTASTLILLASFAHGGNISSLVDTRIGGGGSGVLTGCINPGAQVPYGAMRLGPDTSLGLEPYHSVVSCGYQYKDPQIMCFSHTHLVGAGVSDFQNFGVTIIREIKMDGLIFNAKYGSSFSHDSEIAVPGYYAATLDKWNTRAEVTVGGTHAGMHRYTCYSYDKRNCTVLVDICHSSWSAGNENVNGACRSARINNITFDSDNGATVSAWIDNYGGFSSMGGKGIHIHFVAKLLAFGAQSGKQYSFMQKGVPMCWRGADLHGTNNGVFECSFGQDTYSQSLGALLTVDAGMMAEDIRIEVRTAISFISSDNAAKLLTTQLQGEGGKWKTFEQLRQQTENIWEETLGRVQVDTGVSSAAASRQLTSFYSALYRTHLAPTNYSEFGTYRSENQNIDSLPDDSYAFMSDLSIWDIYRSEMPLTMILEPQAARNTAWTMLQMWNERGFLPVWVLANVETYCMVGEHSAVIMADFIRKGLKGLNNTAVFDAITAGIRSQNQQMMGALHYHPYVSSTQYGSGSDTLDFAIDAAAVRNTAIMMGNTAVANEFKPFADAWRNVWNSERNIFCPKTQNGTWVCPKDDYRPVFQEKYREDNAGEYRWYVPQDLTGLVAIWNNTDAYAQTLNDMFAYGQLWPLQIFGTPDEFFWAGNEPDMLAPSQFPAAGNKYAWLTDKWVAATLHEYYTADPDFHGLPGNDDYGTMSSFEFFAMSGFYPVSSTNDYVLMTPWFVNSTWYVSADGASFSPFPGASGEARRVLQIRAHNHPGTAALWTAAGKLNGFGGNSFFYVQSAKINGKSLDNRTFTQEQLVANLIPGETSVIDITLASEPVVFNQMVPAAGGPMPFMPEDPKLTKEGQTFEEAKKELKTQMKAKLNKKNAMLRAERQKDGISKKVISEVFSKKFF